MEGWMLAIILKPLGLFFLFGFTWSVAKIVEKHLPNGPLKKFLFIRWKV